MNTSSSHYMKNMENDYLLKLLKSKNSVFSTKEVALLWENSDSNFVRQKLYRYSKSGKLHPIHRGFYSKEKDYNKLELATKIYTPAYISLETVLFQEGVVSQFYSQIFIASYLSRDLVIDGQKYSFRKIKNSVLINDLGINFVNGYNIASLERAFLDVIYLNKDYHFDNLLSVDWAKVFKILPIYGNNKRMLAVVERLKLAVEKGLN